MGKPHNCQLPPISPNLFFHPKKQTKTKHIGICVNHNEIGGLPREGADQVVGSPPEILKSQSTSPTGSGSFAGQLLRLTGDPRVFHGEQSQGEPGQGPLALPSVKPAAVLSQITYWCALLPSKARNRVGRV